MKRRYEVFLVQAYLNLQSFQGSDSFTKRVSHLLNSMFTMKNEYVIAAFLHPNYKQLRGATDHRIFIRQSAIPKSDGRLEQ